MPGYFTTTFQNGIKLETTSTRRAGLIRFTYPPSDTFANSTDTFVVIDLANDLQRSFEGGSLSIDPQTSRVTLQGTYLQSYGEENYTVFGYYDFTPPSGIGEQNVLESGTYQSVNASNKDDVIISPNSTSVSFAIATAPLGIETGALLAFSSSSNSTTTNSTVLARFGVSFISTDQACSNAESEIPDWDWDAVQSASQSSWESVLSRIEIDISKENATVVELLYSSVRVLLILVGSCEV